MIQGITEIGFGAGTAKDYATLNNATVSFSEMGDRYISTDVKIDGDVTPDFDGWELSFRGERFILDLKEPNAAKDNTSRNSIINLTFYSWPVVQLKRYFMFEETTTATGTIMADKYASAVSLSVADFCTKLSHVLSYYFHGKISVDLNPGGTYSADAVTVEYNYTYIWDVLQDFYKTFGLRWRIVYNAQTDTYLIKIGYASAEIDDHLFEYGYDGGLLRFERQVQEADVKNILLGRGGSTNVPYRYFKTTDPNNPGWAADPDYVPELANVYFDRIRDINFRRYVQGWRTNSNGMLGAVDEYDAARAATDWAYEKGHTDTTFDPVEYVKDSASILKYGEKWGHLDDNDEIYPTIQGIVRNGGRIDTVIAVSEIVTDDIQASAVANANIVDINGVMSQTDYVAYGNGIMKTIRGDEFTVPTGYTVNVMDNGPFVSCDEQRSVQARISVDTTRTNIKIYDKSTGNEVSRDGLTAGTYYYVINVALNNLNSGGLNNVTYGYNGIYLLRTDGGAVTEWSPTFDIYVRNIFDSQQEAGESNEDYALRVWQEILGDHIGNEATVVFSDGFMSISEDYNFKIATYPVVDRTKTFYPSQGAPMVSEWKITLYKSDAEYDATGLYIPNTTTGGKPIAGDHFFFTGIDMPHMYVTEAEQRLNTYKTDALNDTADISPKWVVSLDKIRIDEPYNNLQETLVSQIDAGVALHLRDQRFTSGVVLDLFVESATFSWQDGTVILPEVDVVLSDEIRSVESRIQTVENEMNVLRASVASVENLENEVKSATRPLYLAKTGEAQTSLSPTKFASLLTSDDFKQGGFGGQGWGLYRDNSLVYQNETETETRGGTRALRAAVRSEDGDSGTNATRQSAMSVMEVDKLIVRHEMMVNNLVINQIAYVGGKQIISAAAMECVQVVENDTSYDCYFDQKQGSVKNLFQVNDIALGQVFSAENIELRYYKRLVTAVGLDYIRLSKSVADGSGVPRAGDVIVQFGNTTNTDRQFAIIRDVIGGGYEQMLSDLDSVYSEGVEYYFAGVKPTGDTQPLADSDSEQLVESGGATLHVIDSSRPRFFIGSQDSYIQFLENEKTIFLKGSIVQSPSGIEFPVPCYVGIYSDQTRYYYGDMVTHNGKSWIHIGQTSTLGTAPSDGNIWRLYTDSGASVYRLDLTNEHAAINANSDGEILPGAVRPSCTAKLYYGDLVVEGAVYSQSTPRAQNVQGLYINPTTGVLTFNSGSASEPFDFDGNSLEITITATKDAVSLDSIMTVTKNRPGADGQNGNDAVSYWLVLSSDKVSVNPNADTPSADPATVTPTAMMQVGEESPTSAASVCIIKYAYDNEAQATIANNTAHTVLLKNASTQAVHRTLHFYLYKDSKVVDQEAVPILHDGQNGESAVTADLSNQMDGIGVGSDGILDVAIQRANALKTVFSLWLGTSPLSLSSLTVNAATVPNGVSYYADANNGQVEFWMPSPGVTLDGRYAIQITGTHGSTSRTLVYTLMGVKEGEDGETFILVPSTTSVKKTEGGTLSVPYVTCDATTSTGAALQNYRIYYSLNDGASKSMYKQVVNGTATYGSGLSSGIPTSSITSTLIFYLYLTSEDVTNDNYIDIETIPLVIDGNNGLHSTVVYLYKRAASAPTVDWSETLTYSFTNKALTSTPFGWSQTIPAADENRYALYVTAATASSKTSLDDIAPGEWAEPVKYVEDGMNCATIMLYKRASTAPEYGPTVTTTYTFATGVLSGLLPEEGWSQTMPGNESGNPCFMVQATAISSTATDTIPPSEWSSPVKILEDGRPGGTGKVVRGPSEWNPAGWGGQGVWMGESDSNTSIDGSFIDIVSRVMTVDGKEVLRYYWCILTHAPTAQSPAPEDDSTHWEVMSNYNLIAARAVLADYVAASSVVVDSLNTGLSAGVEANRIIIEGNKMDVADSTEALKVRISGGTLVGDTGASGTFPSASGIYSGTSSAGDLQLIGTVFQNVRIDSNRNKAELSAFTCVMECYEGNDQVEIDDEASIYAYLENTTTNQTIVLGNFFASVHNTASLRVDTRSLSGLDAGTWKFCVDFSLSTENNNKKIRGMVYPTDQSETYITFTGTYLATSQYNTLIGGDGFLTQWGNYGFKATATGAKVIQGGEMLEAIGGGSLNNLTAPKKLYVCTTLPSAQEAEDGVFYFRVSS